MLSLITKYGKKYKLIIAITLFALLIPCIGKYILINSTACKTGISAIVSDKKVEQHIGSDFDIKYWKITGVVSNSGHYSSGRFWVPINGKKNGGRTIVEVNNKSGGWKVSRIDLILNDGNEINVR